MENISIENGNHLKIKIDGNKKKQPNASKRVENGLEI